MISIISVYPNSVNEKDGMLQRVAAIDSIVEDVDRNYLDISFLNHWLMAQLIINDKVKYYKMNFFLHFFIIMYICMKSNIVYVHSLYNAIRILPIYFFHRNIITDMHGVVVEELKMLKKKRHSIYLFSMVELIVMKYGAYFIMVTESMKKYFLKKYNIEENKTLTISIFSMNNNEIRNKYNNNTFIYSGNIQKWQCVDKLVDFIKNTYTKHEWIVLSGEPDYFKKNLSDKVVIKSVQPKKVIDYYLLSDFGVIFREDDIVNRVACPTKLIEYISNGLIPIVTNPNIGDFYELGYEFLTENDVYDGKIPNSNKLLEMRKKNKKILDEIYDNNKRNIDILKMYLYKL